MLNGYSRLRNEYGGFFRSSGGDIRGDRIEVCVARERFIFPMNRRKALRSMIRVGVFTIRTMAFFFLVGDRDRRGKVEASQAWNSEFSASFSLSLACQPAQHSDIPAPSSMLKAAQYFSYPVEPVAPCCAVLFHTPLALFACLIAQSIHFQSSFSHPIFSPHPISFSASQKADSYPPHLSYPLIYVPPHLTQQRRCISNAPYPHFFQVQSADRRSKAQPQSARPLACLSVSSFYFIFIFRSSLPFPSTPVSQTSPA